ncbi:hypothetical protein FBU59_003363 [Linderina macrospora]|uniref:Uncharacterized protein n=1 Tax=Linderina macrospora TaxID=4868 RepID=A0ACC1J8R3_9FUNG|nr:hypothetical protein FBU59_003363 [Linderina macrospora]
MDEANLTHSGEFSDLMAQSPPALLPASPPSNYEHSPRANSVKRTRADIATPMRPGSDEARRQEEMEYIETPARAPPAMKRFLRSESPTRASPRQPLSMVFSQEDASDPISESLCRDDTPPPKLEFGEEAESVVEVTQRVDSMQVAAQEVARQNAEEMQGSYETVDAKLVGIAGSSVVRATLERSAESALELEPVEDHDSHMEEDVPEHVDGASESNYATPAEGVRLSDSENDHIARAETATAKILSDPELMTAAAMPLPDTPHVQTLGSPQNPSGASASGEFQNGSDWRSSLSSITENEASRDTTLTSSHAAHMSTAMPPEPSAEDRQTELREMLLQALKDDYAGNMEKQEKKAEAALRAAESNFREQMAARERDFEARLAEERAKFDEEMRRQREQMAADADELTQQMNELAGERDELQSMLDEYASTSSKLLEQKEAESNGLSRELGKLTLERNRLQESLDAATARAEALSTERDETQKRVDSVMAENMRLEELNTNLRNDVVVAEERSTKIREYAEDTLAKANNELGRIHDELMQTRQDVSAARAQAAKSDARSRSQSIQLESTKRQNAELLELLEKMQGSF